MQRRCSGKRKDGQPCGSFVVGGSEFCYAHSPEHRSRMHAIRAAGGRARSNQSRSAAALVEIGATVPTNQLPELLLGVGLLAANGEIEAKHAGAFAQCARAAIAAAEYSGIDARLRELEILLRKLEAHRGE